MYNYKVCVLCIAKSGGTTVSNFLHETFGDTATFREFYHLPKDKFGHVRRAHLERLLRSMDQNAFDSIRFLVGHLPVGLEFSLERSPLRYATFIRDPIERAISGFFYGNRDLFTDDKRESLNGLLHRAYSVRGGIGIDNPLTRTLSGSEVLAPEDGGGLGEFARVLPSDLNLALRRLRGFLFVGVTERLDDSLELLLRKIGIAHPVKLRTDNLTSLRLSSDQVHPHTIDLIRRSSLFDLVLYEAAVELFNQEAAAIGLEISELPSEPASSESAGGSFSSGDFCHLTSAAFAFGSEPDGVWLAAPVGSSTPGEFIGYDFGKPVQCDAVELQLVPTADAENVLFQVEASHDDFYDNYSVMVGFGTARDGILRTIEIENQSFSARYWRLRRVDSPAAMSMAICKIRFICQSEDRSSDRSLQPRTLEAVQVRLRAAQSLFEEWDFDLISDPRRKSLKIRKPIGSCNGNVLMIRQERYLIVDIYAGSVESAGTQGDSYVVTGWAADLRANAAVRHVVAVNDSRVLAVTEPSIMRPDIAGGIASGSLLAGFSLELTQIAAETTALDLSLYALFADGTAARLAANDIAGVAPSLSKEPPPYR